MYIDKGAALLLLLYEYKELICMVLLVNNFHWTTRKRGKKTGLFTMDINNIR